MGFHLSTALILTRLSLSQLAGVSKLVKEARRAVVLVEAHVPHLDRTR